MKLTRFKRKINEAQEQDEFNTFVEKTITNKTIDAEYANKFLTDSNFDYKGIVYRVQFFPDAEIMKLADQDGSPNRKMITNYLVKSGAIQPDKFKFFCKSPEGVELRIKVPGLYKTVGDDGTEYIGIVFAVEAPAAIDLSKYSGDDEELKKRLLGTNEVLAFDSLTINNIEGLYYMSPNGWFLETNLDEPLWDVGEETVVGAPEEEEADLTKFQ